MSTACSIEGARYLNRLCFSIPTGFHMGNTKLSFMNFTAHASNEYVAQEKIEP